MTDITRILAARDAVLQRNAALRNIAPAGGTPVRAEAFAAKLNTALTALPMQTATVLPPTDVVPTVQAALARVNDTLEREDVATEAYERGETTDIAAVMLQQQRASVAFETTLQVRNKLLAAYQDIMKMPV
ncbi:flagellar hook-basal body complex protein FliE [Sphingomonadaceae bacterium G21617-S1]|jgi:flagellar hook-basal body complex protein FliE|uniref:flagellar hook-basal body complex protein FliE n=1 Tax=Rhizorhabdus sp. TaxID=1968843 RepID=UPI0022C55B8E|nr:flagellar hook-basal body complex protein FliE [Sphingomonadaceae bacterium G21617-S1]